MRTAPDLERRLASYRAALGRPATAGHEGAIPPADRGIPGRIGLRARVEELAAIVDGEVVRTGAGTLVRIERPSHRLPVDRGRLATLPGQPPADARLVCLDTETTGLATAAGTLAFLVGLGWWEAERFRQIQLLLPDHADEAALLAALAHLLPPETWLVTYNGRGFDWPLLVARFRMARRDPPPIAGHADLLPLVRRVFRHRLEDARLSTVETALLGVRRVGDVGGWEIPGRYLEFVRGGSAAPLLEVVRHNDEDVRSLARLLSHLEQRLGDPAGRAAAEPGDLAGLARAYVRDRRFEDALDCLDVALASDLPARPSRAPSVIALTAAEERWWLPASTPDFGGRPRPVPRHDTRLATPWTEERLGHERARVLRRLGREADAAEAWAAVAAGTSRLAAVAAIELAKLREHRIRDLSAALLAVARGRSILERRRRLGRPEPALEADLDRRALRLRRRLDRQVRGRPEAERHPRPDRVA